jgi:uncharacterized protein
MGTLTRPVRRLCAACAPCLLLQSSKPSLPSRAASAALLGVVAFYQAAVSPLLGRNCRFVPTCSEYIREAVETLGPARGALLGAWRIARCNPAGGSGYDPVRWPPVGFRAGA